MTENRASARESTPSWISGRIAKIDELRSFSGDVDDLFTQEKVGTR